MLVVTRKPRLKRFAMPAYGVVVGAFAADGEIVMLVLAVHVDGEGEVLAGLEQVDLFLQQQGVGAEVDVFLARDQAFDDFLDLRMHERLAAGDADHRSAAFFDGLEALLGREVLLEDVRGVLDLAAAGAGQVAAEERLEHEHQRIALTSLQLLLQDVSSDRPHLRHGYCH